MSSVPPRQFYEGRLAELTAELGFLDGRDGLFAGLRGAVILVTLVMAWAVFDPDRLAFAWLALPVGVFVVLVVLHERLARSRSRVRAAIDFYRRGLARLDDEWAGTGPAGEEFEQAEHPYAADLDLFGEGSMFQLLCAAQTTAGRARLAGWLLSPALPATAVARQAAVAELAPRTRLREDLAVLGAEVQRKGHPGAVRSWAELPVEITAPGRLQIGAAIVTTITLTAGGLLIAGWVSRYWLAAAVVLQGLFALRSRVAVDRVNDAVDSARRELDLLHGLLARFEAQRFAAPLLADLVARLRRGGELPSRQIVQLRRLVDLLDARRNQFFSPISALLLWGTHFAAAIERWRGAHGAAVVEWLEAVAELEALDSLAAYAYEHPDDPFPEIVDTGGARFVGSDLQHPLLAAQECVPNSVSLKPGERVLLVSGSNMSGKSTLMRTVGINAVLAQAGAPVRARELSLSALQVGGSIRVRDSLKQGMSGFYAEIHRFRAILDLAEEPTPVLFLLEEILHTTNSHDRRIGAAALIRSLLGRGAIGLVTTHDLAITALADEHPEVRNVHFVDELADGAIRFDYKLRDGVVQRSNAVELMREIGLDV